jgi:hypothetical protein
MGKMKNIKLKAATLVETIIALVIILVIFGIVTTFLVQVSLNSFSLQPARAAQLFNSYAAATDEKKSFFDEEIEQEGLIINREMIDDHPLPGLVHIKFRVYDKNRKQILVKQKYFFIK